MSKQDMPGLGRSDDDLLDGEDFRPADAVETNCVGLFHKIDPK